MRARHLYVGLALVGALVPGTQLVAFIAANGPSLSLMARQLFATHASAFFTLDVLVSTLVLWAFLAVESRRGRMPRPWAPALASLLVGVSLALPLALYLRETAREA